MKRVLVINGPSLTLLGVREPEIYGKRGYGELVSFTREACEKEGLTPDFFQSNHEGAIVDAIIDAYGKYDGIIINPAAYTHTSVAIADALRAVMIPAAEVHLSDVDAREDFRKISYVADVCVARAYGHGFESYAEASRLLAEYIKKKETL